MTVSLPTKKIINIFITSVALMAGMLLVFPEIHREGGQMVVRNWERVSVVFEEPDTTTVALLGPTTG